mmetsp:Transcript_19025/g.27085  ORF Transcript_19025/g.27085 Transcript_19025/m.27085 type:complete len:226 (-) Transcript_19025:522-1199(-)
MSSANVQLRTQYWVIWYKEEGCSKLINSTAVLFALEKPGSTLLKTQGFIKVGIRSICCVTRGNIHVRRCHGNIFRFDTLLSWSSHGTSFNCQVRQIHFLVLINRQGLKRNLIVANIVSSRRINSLIIASCTHSTCQTHSFFVSYNRHWTKCSCFISTHSFVLRSSSRRTSAFLPLLLFLFGKFLPRLLQVCPCNCIIPPSISILLFIFECIFISLHCPLVLFQKV